jgi:hypothetical protein
LLHLLAAAPGAQCDLRAAPTNVRSWESNGLNADVVFGPFMTHNSHATTSAPNARPGGVAAALYKTAFVSRVSGSILVEPHNVRAYATSNKCHRLTASKVE